jgi:predicted permease
MSPIPNRRRFFRALFGRTGAAKDLEVEEDLEQEIRFHLETRVADLVRKGLEPEQAKRMARDEFGDVERIREELRAVGRRRAARRRREELLSSVLTDARVALRGLRKRPGFTLVATLTLAVAIGGNTAVFSVMDALLLRPLPFPEPEELVQISVVAPSRGGGPEEETSWSHLQFQTFMEAQRVFESAVLYYPKNYNLTQVQDPEELRVEAVTADYFRLLGIPTTLGRFFLPEEDRIPGAHAVAVLSHQFWMRRHGGDPEVVGKSIHLNHKPHTVVGVGAPGFRGLTAGADLWVPTMTLEPQLLGNAGIHSFFAVGRLRDGVTLEEVRGEMPHLAEVVARSYPRLPELDISARPLSELRIGTRLQRAVVILFLAVILVHLIACMNLANLLQARAAGRAKEVAIRAAVGAGRGRLVRQLLTESLVLALVGAGAGLMLAAWGTALLQRMGPSTQSFMAQTEVGLTNVGFRMIGIDGRTMVFGLCLTLLTALLFGLVPAMQASRTDLNTVLSGGRRGTESRNREGWFIPGGRQVVVAAQVALAFVLLAGSGLLIRSLGRLLTADLGYTGERVLSARVQLPRDQYGDYSSFGSDRSALFLSELVERARHTVGVQAAALATCVPLSNRCLGSRVQFPDRPAVERGTEPTAEVTIVEGDYFGTLGIPLERGRLFGPGDHGEALHVVVVNRAAAERFWPGENPIGKLLQVGGWFGPCTVVGVVADVHYSSIESLPGPTVYTPLAQVSAMGGYLVVRGRGDPLALVGFLRGQVREMDPDLPLTQVKTMSEWAADASFTPRFGAALLGLFAAVALLLSAIGVFGVLSFVVAGQTREMGVRMALGARREDILTLVLGRAAGMVIPGAVVGLVFAVLSTQFLRALLFEIHPLDPTTFVGGTLVLTFTGTLASLIPALRATRVDPVEALQAE